MGEIILQMKNITKRYPGVVALNNVSADFRKGEVHALLGENGAGKSTLIKVMSGAVTNDEGQILIDGETYAHMTPAVSRKHGIEVIYQEYNLIPSLSVAENVYLGKQMHGLVDKRTMERETQDIFDRFKIEGINPKSLIRNLSPAQQQSYDRMTGRWVDLRQSPNRNLSWKTDRRLSSCPKQSRSLK